MASPALFLCDEPAREKALHAILRRLPTVAGAPVEIARAGGLRDRRGAVHAGSFLRRRRIVFDCARKEFARIFSHELFHFVWLRAGNPARLSYEELVKRECRAGAPGELGWSAEWRKGKLAPRDIRERTRRWREYCCESFCDAAAWLYSGARRHPEFTLPARLRRRRRAWFAGFVKRGTLSI
ncbi:MAG: hypothetical protein ABSF25_07310 [Bryobacteraceae bacterium]